ncbi:hypothetical protein HDV06_003744 [Boothiomyces sp. JEL0866]|nr:hypothetical protein HDV06_003744 [Boothiomyces sp. JEL0866]
MSIGTLLQISQLLATDNQTLEFLHRVDKKKLKMIINAVMFAVCKNGFVHSLQFLVRLDNFDCKKALGKVLEFNSQNQWRMVQILCKNLEVDGELARFAIQSNHVQLTRLLHEQRRDIWNSVVFWLPCARGNTSIVKLLLSTNADPAQYNNQAIRCAVEKGYYEIVELLIRDSRVDPANIKEIAKLAIQKKHFDIAELLSRHCKIDLNSKKYIFF